MNHLQNGEQTTDLLSSQAHIWNHIFSFINSMVLNCVVQLDIPDIMNKHIRPMTLSELANALPIDKSKSHFVYRLMRILVNSGFFATQIASKVVEGVAKEEECYLLTPASRLLLKDEPVSVRPLLLAMIDPVLITPWQLMSEWFQGGDLNAFYTAHGKSLWDHMLFEPGFQNLFNDAMASDAELVARLLINDFGGVFEGLNSLVDVGGGKGIVAKALAKAFPHLDCINFDLPSVVAGLAGTKNVSHIGGDMFKGIPDADAVLLKWVLHDWDDEECINILKQCKEAIPNKKIGGKVIIIDMVVDEKNGDNKTSYETQLFFDMVMLVDSNGGKKRNEKEWAKLFFDAGFSDYKIMSVLGLRSLIELYP